VTWATSSNRGNISPLPTPRQAVAKVIGVAGAQARHFARTTHRLARDFRSEMHHVFFLDAPEFESFNSSLTITKFLTDENGCFRLGNLKTLSGKVTTSRISTLDKRFRATHETKLRRAKSAASQFRTMYWEKRDSRFGATTHLPARFGRNEGLRQHAPWLKFLRSRRAVRNNNRVRSYFFCEIITGIHILHRIQLPAIRVRNVGERERQACDFQRERVAVTAADMAANKLSASFTVSRDAIRQQSTQHSDSTDEKRRVTACRFKNSAVFNANVVFH